MKIGTEFLYTIRRPWSGKGEKGVEVEVVRCKIDKIVNAGTQFERFDYTVLERISRDNVCPGHENDEVYGSGGMLKSYAYDLLARGTIVLV